MAESKVREAEAEAEAVGVNIIDKGVDSVSKLPWIEKYRPKKFDEIIDNTAKIETIKNLIKNGELPHMLFYGPPGTGKTSMVHIIAKTLYGDLYKPYIMEINASGDRGIDVVRTTIYNFIRRKTDKVKLIILDEADSMTFDAQNALNGMIENWSKTCRFCLLCNNVNKISPAIISRCVRLKFGILDTDAMFNRIKVIAEKESINITDEAIYCLINNQEKDFRKIINNIHSMHFLNIYADTPIDESTVLKFLGKPSAQEITTIVQELFCGTKNFKETYEILLNMYRSNQWNMLDMLNYLMNKIILMESLAIEKRHFLVEKIAEIEFRVRNSRETEIQLGYLVSSFMILRKGTAPIKT